MIFVDPHSNIYYKDELFKCPEIGINGSESSSPLARLHNHLVNSGVEVHTADYLVNRKKDASPAQYYAFNRLDNYQNLSKRKNVILKTFMMMEPPAVAPKLYKALPEITKYFHEVYVHNVDGDGYDLDNVDRSKLRKLYWPQPYKDVLKDFWSNENRQHRIVVINGNHIPKSFHHELYSKRIDAMAQLSNFNIVDLYGRGWAKWWSHRSMWLPYWRNYKKLMSIYRGECESKYRVLSEYKFSLCFENMTMNGYITEKIFDCFYAGTIPLYLGAPNIGDIVPSDAFIDCRIFSSWTELKSKIDSITDDEVLKMKEAGRAFLHSSEGMKFYNSLINIFKS